MYDDTIAAISTPLGEGGIGIIRLSGPEARSILDRVFVRSGERANGKQLSSHRLYHGRLIDPETQATIDEVLAVFMAGPKTYTREDTVELNCHGGQVALQKALGVILRQGARPAEPGEFTLRAFLNGRIDLSQAEAVLDVVRAKTPRGLDAAIQQLSGGLSAKLREVRSSLMTSLAQIQVLVEFPDDDIPDPDLVGSLSQALDQLRALLATADAGVVFRHGVKTAIVGRPNVGKSSLLNALLRMDRAIVADIPGTTRDTVEEVFNLQGVPICLIDTAGIAATDDPVEQLGVERSRQTLASADLVLTVLDGSSPLKEQDRAVFSSIREAWSDSGDGVRQTVVALNKTDLPAVLDQEEVKCWLPGAKVIPVSALTGAGMPNLESTILDAVMTVRPSSAEAVLVTNLRHKEALRRAVDNLTEAISNLRSNCSPDLTAIDLQAALEALGEITGETVTEDLLQRIFSDFCIGK